MTSLRKCIALLLLCCQPTGEAIAVREVTTLKDGTKLPLYLALGPPGPLEEGPVAGGSDCEWEVEALAREHGLLQGTSPNVHLAFKAGDASYWCKLKVTKNCLYFQFDARRVVLDAAGRHKKRLATVGDLSFAAEGVISKHFKEAYPTVDRDPTTCRVLERQR